jgi:hypothetical protein
MRRPDLRFTVRQLMVAVALFSLLFLLGAPLIRVGRPPCLSLPRTASWLIAHPGRANCADCHKVERQPSAVRERIVTVPCERNPDDEKSRTDGGGHIRRAALRSILSAALPSPALPSRAMPGPLPKFDRGAPDQQSHLLPSPPVPSKIPPRPIAEGAQDNAGAFDETDPSELK